MIYDIRQGLIYEIIKPFEDFTIETDSVRFRAHRGGQPQ